MCECQITNKLPSLVRLLVDFICTKFTFYVYQYKCRISAHLASVVVSGRQVQHTKKQFLTSAILVTSDYIHYCFNVYSLVRTKRCEKPIKVLATFFSSLPQPD